MMRPVTVVLLILSALSLAYSGWRIYNERGRQKQDISKVKAEVFFALFILMIFIFALFAATTWPKKLYPLLVTGFGIIFSGWRLLVLLRAYAKINSHFHWSN
ncbi:MAG: hypothetical protein P1P89_19505 [Desulfobacterales bacterium]|nr:hypothetical protein [Desulfobacterales bacterium]